MSCLEGVYWDLDGTIANTELEAHLPAFNNAFNDFGLSWNWDISNYIELLKINGGKNRIAHYSKNTKLLLSNDEVINIHKRKQYHYLKIIENNTVCLKVGVYRLVKELYKKKVRQFIVTSSSKIQVDLLIKKLFKEFNPFDFFITSDDVKFHKPDPSPYLTAMKLSGIKSSKSLVFEDSNPGIISSLAANLPTIYIPSNIPTVIDKDIDIDCIIDSLGNERNKANVIKGPKLDNKYIDYYYLNKYLLTIQNAKD